MTANEDLLFVEHALKRALVTQEQVDEILALKRKLAAMGLPESIADLMVKKGLIPPEEARALSREVSPKGGRRQIEGYRLTERIGRGGMGSVYKGIQISMGRPVAIKVLKPSLSADDKGVERLKREAQLVGKLQHPNIVQGLDHGVSGGFHYFAMEYVEGESVKEALDKRGKFREKEALRVTRDVARALEHAHGQGIVHRDIKPGNILVGRDGKVKLADYGLAKGPLEDVELTQSGVTVGTPQYISPEQARGPSEVDIRTDVYSLGATLYHMVTGRPPYDGDTLAHLIQQVLYEPYAPPQTLRRSLSRNTAFLIEKMMARRARFRYQSPKELLDDLEAIEKGRSIVPSGWAGDLETFHLRRRLRRWFVAAVAVILVGVSATVYTTWRNRLAEQRKLEEAARQGYEILAEIEATPGNIEALIPRFEDLADRYPDTRGAADARTRLDALRVEAEPLDRARETARDAWKEAKRKQYRAALQAIRRRQEELSGDAGRLARRLLENEYVKIEARRNQAVTRRLGEVEGKALSKKPEEARDAIERELFLLRSTAFSEEEPRDLLADTELLAARLGRAIQLTDKALAGARRKLREESSARNYREIERLRAEDEKTYSEGTEIQGLLEILPGRWPGMLRGRFEELRAAILEQNEKEQARALPAAADLAGLRRYEEAIETLDELQGRSLDPVVDSLVGRKDDLRDTLGAGRSEAERRWEAFVSPYVRYLALRRWPAALAELRALEEAPALVLPDPREARIVGAREVHERLEEYENIFLSVIDGMKFVPDGLKIGPTRWPMYDVRVEGKTIYWRRTPGGAEEQSAHVEQVDTADLRRLAGEPPHDEWNKRLANAFLAYREALEKDPRAQKRELPAIQGEVARLSSHPVYGAFAREAAKAIEKDIAAAEGEIGRGEQAARERYDEGMIHRTKEHWQKAYDAFNQLLTDKQYKYTRFVDQRQQQLKDLRAEAERNNSSSRMQPALRAKVAHRGGPPVGEGEALVGISWALDEPSELEAFEFSAGRIGIVDEERLFIGPPARDRPVDEERTVVDRHLRFFPPENLPGDWLHQHPLRLSSPLMYQRPMTISFRARWERPLAFMVSLCGTNLLVLSDTSKKENGRGVYIWQSGDSEDPLPDRITPEELRTSYLRRHPELLQEEEAQHRYFRFEADLWYRIRFVKGPKYATLFVGGNRVFEEKIDTYGKHTKEIVLLTYSPMRLDDLKLEGTVCGKWFEREVRRR